MDPLDERLEALQLHARRYCRARGDEDAAERLVLRRGDDRLTFASLDAVRCGSSISGYLTKGREIETIETTLTRILRMRLRERTIAAAGEEGDPAWSIDVHRELLHILLNSGVHPLLLATDLRDRKGQPTPGPGLLEELTRRRLRFTDFRLRAGRIDTTATIRGDDGVDTITLFADAMGAQTGLILSGTILPATVVGAIAGRRLGEVIDHPLLAGAGDVIVEDASAMLNSTTLLLREDRTTLAPSPIGTPWLELPWTPIP